MSSASTHTPLPHLATFEDLLAIPDGERLHEVKKRRLYADHGVPHYWLVDTERERPIVLRLEKQGFVEVLEAGRGERVRAEPLAHSSSRWGCCSATTPTRTTSSLL